MGNTEKDIFERGLSPKESELLVFISEGNSVPEIAGMTKRSVRTIETQLYRLRRNAFARTSAHLVRIGIEQGWLKLKTENI